MTVYVGIDLGTTNSAICTFDGVDVTLFKSPEQMDVTPSAIFIPRRGNRYVGTRAYEQSARNLENTATLFKRFMGTSTPIEIKGAGITLTPVECSSEILKTLVGYLPEDVRNNPDFCAVITVPAAFNQMQKDATLQAAEQAGIGLVSLMQEPVAAVMSVMRKRRGDGIFLVYDIGGGTLDIAIAQSVGGRVSLLSQGGIAMCGGRDFDRIVVDNIVMPWLVAKFVLPENFSADPQFSKLRRMAEFAAEKAKIELSSRDEAIISAQEGEIGLKDLAGEDIYLDCPVNRDAFDALIEDKIKDSIVAAREAIAKAQLSPQDIERIVFVGGPSQYKPLRDRVGFELGISTSTEVNPMTAVAEGAAIFAESIDWTTQNRSSKTSRGNLSAGGDLDVSFNFVARTPENQAKFGIKLSGETLPGSAFQVQSLDTGWASGKEDLKNGAAINLPLSKAGDNTFKIFVLDPSGGPVALKQDRIVITRTAATVDAIPASHALAVEVRDRAGNASVLDYWVHEGDKLPARGQRKYRALDTIRAGTSDAMNLNFWQGDITDQPSENLFVGLFKVTGQDFEDGIIHAGTEIVCDFEMRDSGNLMIEVSIPSLGMTFKPNRRFYSRQECERNFAASAKFVRQEAEAVKRKLDDIRQMIDDPLLDEAERKVEGGERLDPNETASEETKQALDDVQRAKQLIAKVRKAHLKEFRQVQLADVVNDFEKVRKFASETEKASFEALRRKAESNVGKPGLDFETNLSHLKSKVGSIYVRQPWFVIDMFNYFCANADLFADQALHKRQSAEGRKALEGKKIDALRGLLWQMKENQISTADDSEFFARANIARQS